MIVNTDIALDVKGGGNNPYSFFSREAGVNPTVQTNFDRSQTGTFTLIDPATDTVLPVVDMHNVRGVYIEVDNPTTVFLNGASLVLMPGQQGGLAKLLIETDVTLVSVTAINPTMPVQGTYCLYGYSPAAYQASQVTP